MKMWQIGITLTEDLNVRQMAAKFVPCLLNDQKQKLLALHKDLQD
jgi:hypothetical protein